MVKLLFNLALVLVISSLMAERPKIAVDQPHVIHPDDSKILISEKIEPKRPEDPQIAVDQPQDIPFEDSKVFASQNVAENRQEDGPHKAVDPPHVVQPENIKIFVKEQVERVDPETIDKNADIVEAVPAGARLDAASPRESLFQMLGFNPLPKVFDFAQQQSEDKQIDLENGNRPVFKKLFIFRLFPKLNENGEKKMLGGGGDQDPDFIRFKFEQNGDEMMPHRHHKMSNDDHMMSMVTNKFSLHSMMQHIQNMFNFMESEIRDEDSTDHLPFVYKTNDGGEAIIPQELDNENRMKERKNCMMLSFMRLKASIYYRTIFHLLFFTGVLLFILSMVMITCRSFKKKRYSTLQYRPHNMDVASVDAELVKDKSKFGSIKSWYEITSDRSTLIRGPDNSVVLIQAPPAYDQVIVGDSSKLVDDKAETKSLPPGYDLVNEKN